MHRSPVLRAVLDCPLYLRERLWCDLIAKVDVIVQMVQHDRKPTISLQVTQGWRRIERYDSSVRRHSVHRRSDLSNNLGGE